MSSKHYFLDDSSTLYIVLLLCLLPVVLCTWSLAVSLKWTSFISRFAAPCFHSQNLLGVPLHELQLKIILIYLILSLSAAAQLIH